MENIEKFDNSIIVKPNLGHPIFLKIDPKLKEKHFQTDILIISNIRGLEDFKKNFKDKLTLVPVLDYNWKLKHQFKEKLLEPIDYIKKKGFWARRKEKNLRKKKLR
ncbi:MAG: hypothetical protein ACFFD7_05610, partial [Candidatus Thorarchaeota archaeon]